MSEFDLDLDTLQPEIKKVRLCGKILDVHPPKFNHLVRLMGLQDKFKNPDEGNILAELKKEILPLVPGLDDPEIDITFPQLNSLLEFIMLSATPEQIKKMKEQGIERSTEKKTEVPAG